MRRKIACFLLVMACVVPCLAQKWSSDEQMIVQQLNQSREEEGLAPLEVDQHLVDAARKHSRLMAEKHTLAHVLPGEDDVSARLAADGLHFNRSGENVGYNSNIDDVHSGFMHSPPHRANILTPEFTKVGIGVVRGSDGLYWVTEDFAHTIEQVSGSKAEDLVAQSVEEFTRKHGLPLKHVSNTKLREMACQMAHENRINPRLPLSLTNVRYALAYTNSHPEELPSNINGVAGVRGIGAFSVGTCFSNEPNNPGGTYFVVLAFF